jgi:hypothetical protein
MASLNISTEGTFSSLPDSSLNILHANPGVSTGWISSPFRAGLEKLDRDISDKAALK